MPTVETDDPNELMLFEFANVKVISDTAFELEHRTDPEKNR